MCVTTIAAPSFQLTPSSCESSDLNGACPRPESGLTGPCTTYAKLNDTFPKHSSWLHACKAVNQPPPSLRIPRTSVFCKIAPLKGVRKLLNRSKDVNGDPKPATQLAANDETNQPVPKYSPPPGPPPGRGTIVAADGTAYSEQQLFYLVDEVKDYQITHGSLIKIVQYETDSSVPARPIGVSLLPTRLPRELFDEARELQHIYTELYVRVASDPEWLYSVLEPLIDRDEYIAALWYVYEKVRDAGEIQSVVCDVMRNDYMLHYSPEEGTSSLKQVEINPVSCAGVCHGERVANMHRRLGRVRHLRDETISRSMPESHNVQSIVGLLKAAHNVYKTSNTSHVSRRQCVLMPVQPFNFNIADERPIVYGLWDEDIPCYRCEWRTVLDLTTLTDDRTLLYRPAFGDVELEVSVIYYRGGYEAAEYDEHGRDTRLRLELSKAINCPDVLTHMTTCKSVQEALTHPGAVERFLPAEQAARVRCTFMSMQSLDDSTAGLEARRIAQDPDRATAYVLKPNRDGGGNNTYRSDIPAFLADKPEDTWKHYILMRLIEPPPITGTLMMPADLYHGEIVSELGILGTCMWKRRTRDSSDEVEMLSNEVAGWTFKTKPRDIDEMSVAKGYGCFDCPWLVD